MMFIIERTATTHNDLRHQRGKRERGGSLKVWRDGEMERERENGWQQQTTVTVWGTCRRRHKEAKKRGTGGNQNPPGERREKKWKKGGDSGKGE